MPEQAGTLPVSDTDFRTYQALLANAPDGIVVVDDDGRIVLVNPRAEEMFGYPAGALVGRPIEVLVPEGQRAAHVRHRAGYADAPRTRPMGAGLELSGRRHDGAEFPIDVSLMAVVVDQRRLFAAFVRDITARVEAENALRASEQQFKSLVDSIPDYAIFTLGPDGRITSWGVGAERIKGYSAGDVVGQSIDMLYTPEDVAAGLPARHLAEAADTGVSRSQGWRVRRDGSRFWADVSLTAIFEPNRRLRGFAKVTRDLTEQRLVETRLSALSDLSLAVLKGGSSEDVLAVAAERARRLAEGLVAWAAVATEDGTHVVVAADGAHAADLEGTRLPPAISAVASRPGDHRSELVDWSSPEAASPSSLGRTAVAVVTDGGHVFGLLGVGRARGAREFTTPEMTLIEVLAAQAASALALRAARLEVERLSLTEDQERIARDLHDTVIQRLFATAMSLQSTLRSIDSEAARVRIDQSIDDLDDTIRSIRTTIFGLKPRRESKRSVRQRVLELAAEAASTLGFDPAVRFEGAVDALIGPEILAQLVPTVREALSNVARHAQATAVTLTLQAGDGIALTIADNGAGMPVERRPGGQGLTNMAERARALGGSFRIEHLTSGGTKLEWRVPTESDD